MEFSDFRAIPSKRTQMAPLSCPSCNNDDPMLKIVSDRDENVTLDVCPSCRGTWVDKGELQAMQTETLFGFFKIIRGWFDPKS
ncbi:MAG: zf-TFIIB domain-containing protein [Deltaproteobacteria bacterium]|nr:zf-TFIIB domain-containing protein [Deltaproteobacteria bacterium]